MTKLNNPVRTEVKLGEKTLTIETGRLAKQSNGSVYVQCGESAMLVTVCAGSTPSDLPFLPLTVEFQEKYASAGRIPGGFFKKEARPSEWATLNARMIDRPVRPLFPEGYRYPTQIALTMLNYDGETGFDTLSSVGASAALLLSDLPFTTAIASVRIVRIGTDLVINPTIQQLDQADMNLLVSGTKDNLVMVEGGAAEANEDDVLQALSKAHDSIKTVIEAQEKFAEQHGKKKWTMEAPKVDQELLEQVKSRALEGVKAAYSIGTKMERYAKLDSVKAELVESFKEDITSEKYSKSQIGDYLSDVKRDYARGLTLEGKRIDGRAYDEVRNIEIEAGWLNNTHGSALFTRGETQANVTLTLGTSEDEKMVDDVLGKHNKQFLLHYSFPPYSVGETGRFGGNSRREIGHSSLAERAVLPVLPDYDSFPYMMRLTSDTWESNGSSSMAAVCGSIVAMLDGGVPLKSSVAGIAMGMIQEGEKVAILSDILGDEDHLGDMDFKVCGTEKGITAVQMDIKIDGLSMELMAKALKQAREGRLHILSKMADVISDPRAEISKYAPRIVKITIPTDKIRDVIGSGGKVIREIIATSGAKVDIDDAGVASIASDNLEAIEKAKTMIEGLIEDPEVGKVYMGTVKKVVDFGAFVEILPNTQGLLHISEIDHKRVENVAEYLVEGDELSVKVLSVDRGGKMKLSRKALLPPQA